MSKNTDLENARTAYQHAWDEARKYGDEMLEALLMADLLTSSTSQDLFRMKAERAFTASENWRKSADIALSVMHEIASRE